MSAEGNERRTNWSCWYVEHQEPANSTTLIGYVCACGTANLLPDDWSSVVCCGCGFHLDGRIPPDYPLYGPREALA
jgi:hypothetical protein